ncbi:unnamed protein product, partial [Brassica rapa subsp. narinosa]
LPPLISRPCFHGLDDVCSKLGSALAKSTSRATNINFYSKHVRCDLLSTLLRFTTHRIHSIPSGVPPSICLQLLL